MKIRTGFVSNSSSSSFVVALDSQNTKTTVTVSFDIDLESHSDHRISTIEELDEYYDYEWGERNGSYKKCKKAIKAGKIILVGSFTDESDEAKEVFLCDNGLKGNIPKDSGVEIIHSEGGY